MNDGSLWKLVVLAGLVGLVGVAAGETVVLLPGEAVARDAVWAEAPDVGKLTWGLPGNTADGRVDAGSMSWVFPGPSGRYRITVGAILDGDVAGAYRLYAGEGEAEVLLAEGAFPRYEAVEPCTDVKVPGEFVLGEFTLEEGQRLRFWGESAYCRRTETRYSANRVRFWEIRCESVGAGQDR